MSHARRLVSIRRRVPAPLRDRYDQAWDELARRVSAGGAHAWRFVAAEAPDLHVEFLEFAAGADPRHDPEVAAALRVLGAVAAADAEEWVAL